MGGEGLRGPRCPRRCSAGSASTAPFVLARPVPVPAARGAGAAGGRDPRGHSCGAAGRAVGSLCAEH